MEMVTAIIINIILLFGILFLYNFFNVSIKNKQLSKKVIYGLFIGGLTIILMENSWLMADGVMYDSRSIAIVVTAFFFSPVTSIIAVLIAVGYRALIGGMGVYAGILTIVTAFLTGYIWRVYLYDKLSLNKTLSLYLMGIVAHILMLLSMFALPWPQSLTFIRQIALIVLVFYPIGVLLFSLAIIKHEDDLQAKYKLEISEKRYQNIFENSVLGFIQFDDQGVIEMANKAFAKFLGTEINYLIGLDMLTLDNQIIVKDVKKCLAGHVATYEGKYKSVLSGKEFPTRAKFYPVKNNNQIIGGIGIIEDLTDEVQSQKQIKNLERYDVLTNLFNRKSFERFLYDINTDAVFPVGIALGDMDSFQLFNTTLGFEAGNRALIEVTNILEKHTDHYQDIIPFRIEGDEFALISQNTTKKEIQSILKAIQDDIAQIDSFEIDISITFGHAFTENKSEDLIDIYHKAMTTMQQNKIYHGSSFSTKTVNLIMTTLFTKSKRERLHSERVSQLTKIFAKTLTDNTQFIQRITLAAKLHDIGKINISGEILDKPNRLSKDEYDRIKKHPEAGYKILNSVPEYSNIANIIYTHHERFDGTGYPRKLKGNSIPLEARIISVVDAFDAMTETRPYRKALSKQEAIQELKDHAKTQFCPDIVKQFIDYISKEKTA